MSTMRKHGGLLLLVVMLGALAGCTPADVPIVGLAVRDGQPVGVIVPCADQFTQLSVYKVNQGSAAATDEPFTRWGVNGTPATTDPVEVALFGPAPEGWRVDLPDSDDVELTALTADAGYSLGGRSRYNSIDVPFTVADLARIGPDQVLAPVDHDEFEVMSRDAFLREARGHCRS
jgi:hypothetical protein